MKECFLPMSDDKRLSDNTTSSRWITFWKTRLRTCHQMWPGTNNSQTPVESREHQVPGRCLTLQGPTTPSRRGQGRVPSHEDPCLIQVHLGSVPMVAASCSSPWLVLTSFHGAGSGLPVSPSACVPGAPGPQASSCQSPAVPSRGEQRSSSPPSLSGCSSGDLGFPVGGSPEAGNELSQGTSRETSFPFWSCWVCVAPLTTAQPGHKHPGHKQASPCFCATAAAKVKDLVSLFKVEFIF